MISTNFTPSIPDLIKEIGALEEGLQRKAVTSGLTASAKPLKDRLKQNAPSDSGALKGSIGQVVLSLTAKARLGFAADVRAILVGPVRKANSTLGGVTKKRAQGYKAHWLEEGTKAHTIKPRKKGGRKALSFGGGFVKEVNHPGISATHFMGNAYQQTQASVNDNFYQGLSRYLDKIRKVA
ncbi:MAG: HK97 gp10 family phage protein [Gammaproteobacteria bacterium]|nr:HK97 gp10 family phage protein [Gammaproteobacteria bacterium]